MALRSDHSMLEQGTAWGPNPHFPEQLLCLAGHREGDGEMWSVWGLAFYFLVMWPWSLSNPSFLHLQSEPPPPLMQGSWENSWELFAQGRGDEHQCLVLERQLCWVLRVPLGGCIAHSWLSWGLSRISITLLQAWSQGCFPVGVF